MCFSFRALEETDRSIFQGRLLHVMPAKQKHLPDTREYVSGHRLPSYFYSVNFSELVVSQEVCLYATSHPADPIMLAICLQKRLSNRELRKGRHQKQLGIRGHGIVYLCALIQ